MVRLIWGSGFRTYEKEKKDSGTAGSEVINRPPPSPSSSRVHSGRRRRQEQEEKSSDHVYRKTDFRAGKAVRNEEVSE